MRPIEYVIDTDDRIVAAAGGWSEFAAENDAPELSPARVLGTPLLDWFAGDDLRQLWRELLAVCRRTNTARTFPYRCDAPDFRRALRMTLTPRPDGSLHFRSVLDHQQQRPRLELLRRDIPRREQFVLLCSWCKCMKMPSGAWADLEIAVTREGLLNGADMPQLSHGICPSCRDLLLGGPLQPASGGPWTGTASVPRRDLAC
ncbi:MAG: hypothetical protein IPM29_24615 [Planctomycetes bacterium]|nr:hypothetical protein [Planctomycetota bacterium]